MVGPHLDFFARTPEWQGLTAQAPNLVAWLARLEDRPAMKATTWTRVKEMAAAG
jgi:glutathione S-transferase